MKLTSKQLRQLIKEEINSQITFSSILNEQIENCFDMSENRIVDTTLNFMKGSKVQIHENVEQIINEATSVARQKITQIVQQIITTYK